MSIAKNLERVNMALRRDEKDSIVAGLSDGIKGAESVVFVNFHGLGVSESNAMRSALRGKGVSYKVAKKTLIKRALGSSDIKGDMPELPGEVAIAYASDPVAPASGIAEFAKKYKEQLALIGGIFEGRFMDRSEAEALAAIPSMEILRGMFVNVINSPIAGLAVALHEIAKKKEA